jgi:hypothetical protein
MKDSDYNLLSRVLHNIVLGSNTISEISHDIEKNLFLKRDEVINSSKDNHLFIGGMARSGSTALLESLYATGRFASLTYSDMPFVLAPNLFKRINGTQTSNPKKERAHKDGIFVNNQSPEALSEVFWKVFLNNRYIGKDRLEINKIPPEILDGYADYITLIIRKYSTEIPKRYLSKNNNNILRIHPLIDKFPNSFFLAPYRHPLQHAQSLQHQHKHFTEIHRRDLYSLKYMNWIGHHEFGLNQKPFYLDNPDLFDQMQSSDKDDINFWLLSWLNYYTYLISVVENLLAKGKAKNLLLVRYEDFCSQPNEVLGHLSEIIDLKGYSFRLSPFQSKSRDCEGADALILKRCINIYERLGQYTFYR